MSRHSGAGPLAAMTLEEPGAEPGAERASPRAPGPFRCGPCAVWPRQQTWLCAVPLVMGFVGLGLSLMLLKWIVVGSVQDYVPTDLVDPKGGMGQDPIFLSKPSAVPKGPDISSTAAAAAAAVSTTTPLAADGTAPAPRTRSGSPANRSADAAEGNRAPHLHNRVGTRVGGTPSATRAPRLFTPPPPPGGKEVTPRGAVRKGSGVVGGRHSKPGQTPSATGAPATSGAPAATAATVRMTTKVQTTTSRPAAPPAKPTARWTHGRQGKAPATRPQQRFRTHLMDRPIFGLTLSLGEMIYGRPWPRHSPACARRFSSLASKTRTWPFASTRASAPSLKPWPGSIDNAGARKATTVSAATSSSPRRTPSCPTQLPRHGCFHSKEPRWTGPHACKPSADELGIEFMESGDTYQRQVLSIFSIASGMCLLGAACTALYRRNRRRRRKLQAHLSQSRSLRNCGINASALMSKSASTTQSTLQKVRGAASPAAPTPLRHALGGARSKGKRFRSNSLSPSPAQRCEEAHRFRTPPVSRGKSKPPSNPVDASRRVYKHLREEEPTDAESFGGCDASGGKVGALLSRTSHFAGRKGWTEVPCTRLDKGSSLPPPSPRARSVPIIPSLQARDLEGRRVDTTERTPGGCRVPAGSPSPPPCESAPPIAARPPAPSSSAIEMTAELDRAFERKNPSSAPLTESSGSHVTRGGAGEVGTGQRSCCAARERPGAGIRALETAGRGHTASAICRGNANSS